MVSASRPCRSRLVLIAASEFQPMCGMRASPTNRLIAPGKTPRPRLPGDSSLRFKQTLQADANAEKRHSGPDPFKQRLTQAEIVHRTHHLAEVPDAREDDLVCSCAQPSGSFVTSYGASKFVERVLDRPNVAGAVIDDGRHSRPLVEGS